MSRIKVQLDGVNLFEEDSWSKMNELLVENLPKFESCLAPVIAIYRNR